MRTAALLAPILLAAAYAAAQSEKAADGSPGVWFRATRVAATRADGGCDPALRRFEAQLRDAMPGYGYKFVREEVRRAGIGERVEFAVDDRETVDLTPRSADDRAVRAEMRVRRGDPASPWAEDRRSIRVWHHKPFAVGTQGPEGSTLLLIEAWR